jgi:hypothetical protein
MKSKLPPRMPPRYTLPKLTHSRFLTDISPSRIVCRIMSQLVRFSTTTSEGLTAGESLWQKKGEVVPFEEFAWPAVH